MSKGDEKCPKGHFSQFRSRLGWFNEGFDQLLFSRKGEKVTSDEQAHPPQSDEWGRLNQIPATKGDQKVTKK